MADEARLNELLDLVEQARAEGDTATEQKAVAAYKRESAPQAAPRQVPTIGGTGGYNPFLPRVMGAQQVIGNELGLTPENTQSPIKNALGPLETGAQAVSSAALFPVSGIAGVGQSIWNAVVPKSMEGPEAADRVRQIQGLAYQPRTGVGQGMSRAFGAPGEIWQAGTNKVGEVVTDVTGSPALGTAFKTAGDIVPGVVGARATGARPPTRQPSGNYTNTADAVPTTEQLKAAAEATYKAADESNVVIRPESTRGVISMIDRIAEKENLGKLPPKMKEARDLLAERADAGKPLSLSDADKVRQIINDAKKSQDAADQRLAKIAQKEYDNYLDNLKPSDTLTGDSARGVALLKEARDLFRRRRGSEMIDSMERKAKLSGDAKYSQAGLEHALRQEFLKLARNDRKMKTLTPAQQAAIERVASPGLGANALRNIGKFDPVKGGMPAFMTSVLGGGGGALLAGPAGAVAGPAIVGGLANLANRGTARITKGNVNKAREALVGRESSGGLLSGGPTTQPLVGPGGPLAGTAARAAATPRTVAAIQQDIQRLSERARFELANEPANSPRIQLYKMELARLQSELATTGAGQ